MKELFSLGELYPSDFLKPGEPPRCPPVEIKLMLDDNGAVRLKNTAPENTMWGKYWYRSSMNSTMKIQLKDIVDSVINLNISPKNGLWVDIASNDGFLLCCVPDLMLKIGIDPAEDSFRIECERHADLVIQDYFSADGYKKTIYGDKKPNVITAISMFYDLDEPQKFLHDVYEILDNDGLFVLQLSYTPLMLIQMAFDNICHEHLWYYSLFNIKSLIENAGFKIMDCQLNDTNAGSFRIFIMKKSANLKLFSTQAYRDVCEFRINSLLHYEKTLRLDDAQTWINFYLRIESLKKQTTDFIKKEKAKGKVIMGYGASTKGNTLLQYFGLDSSLITAIADRSTYKIGLHTIETNIPIISEDDMRKANPDYLLILPWHFIKEFCEREKKYLQNGGKFIVPCPTFEIIQNENT